VSTSGNHSDPVPSIASCRPSKKRCSTSHVSRVRGFRRQPLEQVPEEPRALVMVALVGKNPLTVHQEHPLPRLAGHRFILRRSRADFHRGGRSTLIGSTDEHTQQDVTAYRAHEGHVSGRREGDALREDPYARLPRRRPDSHGEGARRSARDEPGDRARPPRLHGGEEPQFASPGSRHAPPMETRFFLRSAATSSSSPWSELIRHNPPGPRSQRAAAEAVAPRLPGETTLDELVDRIFPVAGSNPVYQLLGKTPPQR
jgi:hypothetical protein